MLEGKVFQIYTDQKPLIYAFRQNPNKCSSKQLCYLDFISQYSTDTSHVQGSKNVVSSSLSRIEMNSITKYSFLNFNELAKCQEHEPETQRQKFLTEGQKLFSSTETQTLPKFRFSTNSTRPFVPKSFRRLIFE
ncbi:integrase_H2C2 domain-containing protein [Nephila pilipes]|uniref:Integrase_H2C2 domain-containing protein n=1 Tax=Nephila pilipes TaxID=299642 RepID=A0A8X6NXL7_NEPPI|nr:integrase_H2C2 domain-containing protein [Nephila pilipes]